MNSDNAQEILSNVRTRLEVYDALDIIEEDVTLYCQGCKTDIAVEHDLSHEVRQHLDACPSYPNRKPYTWPMFTVNQDIAVKMKPVPKPIDVDITVGDDDEDPRSDEPPQKPGS